MEETFTKENFDNLKTSCNQIILLSDENIEGNLMYSQMIFLGEKIKTFINNPIVKNSGIIK